MGHGTRLGTILEYSLNAFDDPEHFAQPTMQRVSKRLFDKETKTPEIAERIVNLYKSLEENHNKRQKKGQN